MNQPASPRFTSTVLVTFAILTIGTLLFQSQLVPAIVDAQETSTPQQSDTAQTGATVIEYVLMTQLGGNPAMAFVGVGGSIDGVVNPELHATTGDTIRLTIVNGDAVAHDLRIDEFNVNTGELTQDEETVTVEFIVTQPGIFDYYCSLPGHRDIGMKGILVVVGDVADSESEQVGNDNQALNDQITANPADNSALSVIRHPSDLPDPIADRAPATVVVNLTTKEVSGVLGDGTTYSYMTFDGQVPGPMIRVMVGDTVEVHLHNDPTSKLPHSIDLHAVTGPGGGAVYTQTLPGDETSFTFLALQAGLYVYHCATASIGHHITSGMYGLILVEPIGGLPRVDREFYVMQGEIYTVQPFGTQGHLDFSYEKMLDEDAEHFVFNGAAGALTTEEHAMYAKVGESVRIYFGVGGPNATSALHLIGEIFDKVYDQASLTSPALTDVQTTVVPPGGATVVEFTLNVPGRYILVDHALSRLERGLVGFLYVEGNENPAIYHSDADANEAGH